MNTFEWFQNFKGMTLLCPVAVDDSESQIESFSAKSIHCKNDEPRSKDRPVSCNGRESEPATVNSFGSKKTIIEEFYSFKERECETKISLKQPAILNDLHSRESKEGTDELLLPGKSLQKNNQQPNKECECQAAIKLQKTYKSFRTRRQLADCAVLVEQRWWKLLDFAELRRNSVSFFDLEKPETAVSRWSRARTKAAKVGKGLSKDGRARKLALKHWLEAIDPRHRYGHNLQFYYTKWLHCESKEPFFYWLDIGEGKEVNLEKCSRAKLQQQCIKYLGPMERKEFEVRIDNGKFIYNQSGMLLDTRGAPEDTKWIFVLSVSKILYVGQKKKGLFQHSSFLAGGATLAAGRLIVEDGILKTVWPHSGHYLPTEENFEEFMLFLKQHNVDLSVVQKVPKGEDKEAFVRRDSGFLRNSISEPDFSWSREEEQTDSCRSHSKDRENISASSLRCSQRLRSKIFPIQIPKRKNMLEFFHNEKQQPRPSCCPRSLSSLRSPVDGYETAEEYLSDSDFSVSDSFDDDQEGENENPVEKEKIYERIPSQKGMKSYKLAQQLSSQWSTGAGARIGFVRDFPPDLQCRALEEVCLSPRSSSIPSPNTFDGRPTSRVPAPSNLCRKTDVSRSPFASEPVMVNP